MKLFYYILNSVLLVLALVLAYIGIIEWVDAITFVVLIITAIAVGMQAFATNAMAKYQLMPAVDINMVYRQEEKRTYFWFSNSSNLPAVVSLRLTKRGDDREQLHIQSLRLPPQRKMCTMAIVFYEQNHSTKKQNEFNPSEGEEVTLNVCIKLALENFDTKYNFKKDYRFHEYPDKSGLYRWDEITWGFPDPEWSEK